MSAQQPADMVHTNESAAFADRDSGHKAIAKVVLPTGSPPRPDDVGAVGHRPPVVTTDRTLFKRIPLKGYSDGLHVRRGDRVEFVVESLAVISEGIQVVGHVAKAT
jgi:hypothetical protein